jgi:hypothetical protein
MRPNFVTFLQIFPSFYCQAPFFLIFSKETHEMKQLNNNQAEKGILELSKIICQKAINCPDCICKFFSNSVLIKVK